MCRVLSVRTQSDRERVVKVGFYALFLLLHDFLFVFINTQTFTHSNDVMVCVNIHISLNLYIQLSCVTQNPIQSTERPNDCANSPNAREMWIKSMLNYFVDSCILVQCQISNGKQDNRLQEPSYSHIE